MGKYDFNMNKKYTFLFFILLFQISKASIQDGNYIVEVFDSPANMMHGQFAINSKGDMIIEYSEDNGLSRIFYGIKENEKGFFNGEYIKIIRLGDEQKRFESKNIFIYKNNSNDDNTQYLLSLGAYISVSELYNIDDNNDISNTINYLTKVTSDILGNSIFSFKNSIIDINNDKKEYLIAYIYDKKYYLQIIAFSSFSLDNISIKKINTQQIDASPEENRMVDTILLNKGLILVLFINKNNIYINLIDLSLENIFDQVLDSVDLTGDNEGLFAKSFNLKDDYILFIYFPKTNDNLKLSLGQINSNNNYSSILTTITPYKYLSNPILNEAIQINSERCAFFGIKSRNKPNDNVGEISDALYILLIDTYNNYQNIIIREYEMVYNSYKTHKEITAIIYNNFICVSSSVYKTSNYSYGLMSMFMIIGYFNETNNNDNNFTINIYDYFLNEEENNIIDIIINRESIKNIKINNNFFGYELSQENIRLTTIPDEIEFYNKNNVNAKLLNGNILNKNYTLKERETKVSTQGNYYFEYQIIVQEPDYDTFNSYFINISTYHSNDAENIDQRNFFKPQQFYGKIFSVNFILCPESYLFDSLSNQCQYVPPPTTYINKPTIIITNDICSYEKLKDNNCVFETNNNNTQLYNQIKENILQEYPEDGESVTIDAGNGYIFQVTNLENELSSLSGNASSNVSIIDLGECGDLLKEHHNISENQSLIFIKYEKVTEIASERDIQYEVYHPINKEKLNLSICEDVSISIYIPITLSEEAKQKYEELEKQGYDLFNPNDSFYQDICTPFESENGTDVGLNDRKNDYYKNYNNNTQCQGNCQYSDYLSNSNFLKCDCSVDVDNNIETENKEEVSFDNKMIYESFYDILKNSNYKVVKCYNLIFSKDTIFKNYGSILVMVYFIIFLVFFILYIIQGINPFRISALKSIAEKEINKGKNSILFSSLKFNNIPENNNENNKSNNDNSYKKISKKSLNPPKKSSKSINLKTKDIKSNKRNSVISKKSANVNNINNRDNNKYKNVVLLNNKVNVVNNSNQNKNKEILINDTYNNQKQSSKNVIFNQKIKNNLLSPIKQKEIEEEKNFDDFELNNMDYLEAIQYDQRNFIKTYWSILKREHIIIFTFFIRNDYNIVHIKFSRFIFLVCTDMAMNVIFFTDDSMHKIYTNYGKYDFIQQIPQIIYSTIVSQVMELILCYLSLTDKHLYQIKELENGRKNMEVIFRIIKCVKIKLIGFYSFTFIFFFLYWYLISAFCAVYQNTQVIFIKDSLSSFALGLLYPFILYLFPALLRIIALNDRNKKRLKVIYAISDIIPIF